MINAMLPDIVDTSSGAAIYRMCNSCIDRYEVKQCYFHLSPGGGEFTLPQKNPKSPPEKHPKHEKH